MRKSLKAIVVIAVLLLVPFACRHDDINPMRRELEGMTKLGRKLENPYSVKNMKKALENIKASNANARTAFESIEIEPTHFYVKFEPKTEVDLDYMKQQDSTIAWYDHPLDVEIEEGGEFYHDPTLPLDQPTYQYASITADYVLPTEIDYTLIEDQQIEQPIAPTGPLKTEIEEELFIPDDGTFLAAYRTSGMTQELVDALVYEAFKITDNLDDIPNGVENGRMEAANWYPQGVVKVWDDVVQKFVPVHDVEVRARRWFTTRRDKTNINGEYRMDKEFKNPANYSIRWEKYQFSVRSGTFGQAGYNGPKKEGHWNPKFGNEHPSEENGVIINSTFVSNKQQYYALIFQAARDYFYGDRFGLASPPKNGFFKPQVKIAADVSERQNEKDSHAAHYARLLGILPSAYIREWKQTSAQVYAITAHEMAHLAHWDMDRDTFTDVATDAWNILTKEVKDPAKAAVIESWATGVEICLHRRDTKLSIT